MKLETSELETMMDEALSEARKASDIGEVPIGAVVVKDGEIIARAHNEVESLNDSSAHAEVLALRRAATALGDWRLNDTQLYVTLEPCTMCVGAIKLARVPVVVFGAKDQRLGACCSLFDLVQDSRLGPVARVVSGVREHESIELLQSFFKVARG